MFFFLGNIFFIGVLLKFGGYIQKEDRGAKIVCIETLFVCIFYVNLIMMVEFVLSLLFVKLIFLKILNIGNLGLLGTQLFLIVTV